jgi:Ca2+/H+ antiporter
LLLELAMGIGLTLGAWLARRQRYKAHGWCQSLIVLLNLAIIAMEMIPSFRTQVLPRIPENLSRPFYAIAMSHALLASVAEVAALYLMLSAGTKILPERWRPTNLKVAMRAVLASWWLSLLLGIATYVRWYVPLK